MILRLNAIFCSIIEEAGKSWLKQLKKLFHCKAKTIVQKGDLSCLQEIIEHVKQKNCAICHKHSPSTDSKELLRQITISIGSPQDAPRRMQINFIRGPLYPELNSGEYDLQKEKINGLPSWKHTKLAFVIWYNKDDDRWMLSHSKDIGTSEWIFAGPVGSKKWPNEINFKGKILKKLLHLQCKNLEENKF